LGATVLNLVTLATWPTGFCTPVFNNPAVAYQYIIIVGASFVGALLSDPVYQIMLELQESASIKFFQSFSMPCVRSAVNYEKELLRRVVTVIVYTAV
jgi:hypothetical protein